MADAEELQEYIAAREAADEAYRTRDDDDNDDDDHDDDDDD
jgi:hypothetical protein